jgi:hypothetical protein
MLARTVVAMNSKTLALLKERLFTRNGATRDFDISVSSPDEIRREFIAHAKGAHQVIRDFLPMDQRYQFASLGENCSSAWYLKQSGLKAESYPFDWIFSSPEIVLHCIEDEFKTFLDKSLIEPSRDGHSAGHAFYHSKLFNHRNPLGGAREYGYITRCCERFLEFVGGQHNAVYFITLINEPDVRSDWAEGFNNRFALPRDQGLDTVRELMACLIDKNHASRFIVVDHSTNGNRHVAAERVDERTVFIDFRAAGASTGVYYADPLDDFCYKLVMAGLVSA